MTLVRPLLESEREDMRAFLDFVQAEPYPDTAAGWEAREAEARRRWPGIAELFEGWGVDVAATARPR